ncbi:MAG: hypothetical protein WKF78_10785 [Candidatus Limnocylindrales bacterium]
MFGDFTSDPKCLYDSATGRFFLTVLQADIDSESGEFSGRTHVYLAVSRTSDPVSGGWYTFVVDTTNDGANGTPSHAGCPCLGDQPSIGTDANGFYISTNEFPLFSNGFNGAMVYALSKASLESGSIGGTQAFFLPTLAEGQAYTVQPATTPGRCCRNRERRHGVLPVCPRFQGRYRQPDRRLEADEHLVAGDDAEPGDGVVARHDGYLRPTAGGRPEGRLDAAHRLPQGDQAGD